MRGAWPDFVWRTLPTLEFPLRSGGGASSNSTPKTISRKSITIKDFIDRLARRKGVKRGRWPYKTAARRAMFPRTSTKCLKILDWRHSCSYSDFKCIIIIRWPEASRRVIKGCSGGNSIAKKCQAKMPPKVNFEKATCINCERKGPFLHFLSMISVADSVSTFGGTGILGCQFVWRHNSFSVSLSLCNVFIPRGKCQLSQT